MSKIWVAIHQNAMTLPQIIHIPYENLKMNRSTQTMEASCGDEDVEPSKK